MRCRHPLTVSVDGRREFVPCGKCNFCLEARRADWSFRLRQELKVSSSAYFLTLTYEKAPITKEGLQTLSKRDLQLFIKRLRKASKNKLRYYAVGEYGTKTERPHYHALLFNVESKVLELLFDIWSHGLTYSGTVTDASIHYVTKYHVNKFGDYPGRAPPFVLMSRRPGIGANYLTTNAGKYHLFGLKSYVVKDGFKGRLPRFYADKLFSKEDKAHIQSVAPSEREAYLKEIKRLSKFVSNPHEHYLERVVAEEKAIKHKHNKKDKF